ncbi:MAG: thioredoxin family protein [Bacteroidota bacterium]|nr:thioredoxin family protein [Bacteroidota bacterium]
MNKFAALILLLLLSTGLFAQEIINLTPKTFKSEIWDYENNEKFKFKGNKPVILDITADWCRPCRMMKPILKSAQKKHGNDLQIYTIDSDKYPELSGLFKVKYLPTLIFINPKKKNTKRKLDTKTRKL